MYQSDVHKRVANVFLNINIAFGLSERNDVCWVICEALQICIHNCTLYKGAVYWVG